MKKGSRSKKAVRRKMMLGTILCIAALCAGCGKKASEEAAQTQVPTTQETTTQAATSAPKILIQSDEEQKEETKDLPDYNLPEEREEKDGMIRSFLTGQMVPKRKLFSTWSTRFCFAFIRAVIWQKFRRSGLHW